MSQSCSLLSPRCQKHETHPEAPCAGAGGVKEVPAPGQHLSLNISLLLALLPHLIVLLWALTGWSELLSLCKKLEPCRSSWGSWCPSLGAASCSGEDTLESFLPWQLHLCSSPAHSHPASPSLQLISFSSVLFLFLGICVFGVSLLLLNCNRCTLKCFKLKGF